jgi:hypothetical protein
MANAGGKNTTSRRKKPSGKKLPNIGSARTVLKWFSTPPESVGAMIALDAVAIIYGRIGWPKDAPTRDPSDAEAKWKKIIEDDEAAFAAQQEKLFAEMCMKLGRAAARKILMRAMRGSKQQTDTRLEEDRALQLHRFVSGSTRTTAKRAKQLGLRGSPEAIEQRVTRSWRKMVAANPHLARGGSDK